MPKILLTGATGFIGQHVLKELVENYSERFQIIASGRSKEKLHQIREQYGVGVVECNLDDQRSDWFEYTGKPDILIHLAWGNLENFKSRYHIENELPKHIHFLSSMLDSGLKSLSVSGTCLEYGVKNGALDESFEVNPTTAYAVAKDSLRRYLEILKNHYEFELTWLRYFYMYGEGQRASSLLAQLENAVLKGEASFNMSGGEQLRDYLSVVKVAEYTASIALHGVGCGVVNICSGTPISIRSLVEKRVAELRGSLKLNLGYYPYPDYEAMAFWGENKKLRNRVEELENG